METTDSGSSFEISTSTQLDFENILFLLPFVGYNTVYINNDQPHFCPNDSLFNTLNQLSLCF